MWGDIEERKYEEKKSESGNKKKRRGLNKFNKNFNENCISLKKG